jgi:hypothetical protein
MPNPFENFPGSSNSPKPNQPAVNTAPNPPPTPNPNPPTSPPTTPSAPPVNKFAEIEKLQQTISSTPPTPNNSTTNNNPPENTQPLLEKILNLITNNKKIIFGVIAFVILVIIGVSIYRYLSQNKSTLNITLTDQPDKFTINAIDYPTGEPNQTIILKPGTYVINASKDQNYPYTNTIDLTAQQTKDLSITFQPYPSSTKLIEYTTSFPHLDPSETELSYLSNFGTTFYIVKLDSPQKGTSSPNNFNHITNTVWAPSSRKAVLIKSNNDPALHQYQTKNILYQKDRPLNSTVFSLFDFNKYDSVNQNIVTYPTTVKNPSWHPTKEEIIFHFTDPKTSENSLSKSKPNLDNRELLVDLEGFANALVKYSPDEEMIAIVDMDKTTTAEPNPVYLFYTVPRNFEKIPTKEIFQDIIWSPDSTKLIAIKNNDKPTIFDAKTYQATDIDIKASADRIAWFSSSDKLIIFPNEPNSSGQMLIYDLATGQTEPIKMKDAANFQTITNPILNRANNILYYIGDNYMYSLAIK